MQNAKSEFVLRCEMGKQNIELRKLAYNLCLAVEKSPDKISDITAQIDAAFKELTNDQLATALSEKIVYGDSKVENTLYQLMLAHSLAVEKSPEYIPKITNLIATVFERLSADQLHNALHRLVVALYEAAKESPKQIPGIAKLIATAFEILSADQLATVLSTQKTEGKFKGENALYRLMFALSWAAEKSGEQIPEITKLIATVFERLSADQLHKALSAQITEGDLKGENAIYRLMLALTIAAEKSPNNIPDITAPITTAIKTLSSDQLAEALSAQITKGDYTGTNGWYWVMSALHSAATKNNINAITEISKTIQLLIDKCSEPKDIEKLIAGLSEKRMRGDSAGANGWYWVMSALHNAAYKNNIDAVTEISKTIQSLIDKCSEPKDIEKLIAGLSEKGTQGDDAGTNGWYALMGAIDEIINSQLHVAFFNLLAKLPAEKVNDKIKQEIFGFKRKLKPQLITYLDQHKGNSELKSMCNPNTLLGAFIDYQTGLLFRSPMTDTRKMVNKLLAQQQGQIEQQSGAPAADDDTWENLSPEKVSPPDTETESVEGDREESQVGTPMQEGLKATESNANTPAAAAKKDELPPPSYEQIMQDRQRLEELRKCKIETLKRAERIYEGIGNPSTRDNFSALMRYINAKKEKGYDILSDERIISEIRKLSARVKEKYPAKTQPISLASTQHTLFRKNHEDRLTMEDKNIFIQAASKLFPLYLSFDIDATKKVSEQYEQWVKQLDPSEITQVKGEVMRMISEEELKLLEKSLAITVPSGNLPVPSDTTKEIDKKGDNASKKIIAKG